MRTSPPAGAVNSTRVAVLEMPRVEEYHKWHITSEPSAVPPHCRGHVDRDPACVGSHEQGNESHPLDLGKSSLPVVMEATDA